jgi:hypothetical protein
LFFEAAQYPAMMPSWQIVIGNAGTDNIIGFLQRTTDEKPQTSHDIKYTNPETAKKKY